MGSDDDFAPPAQFDEYRLIRSLGRGGMGEVFLCHDTKLDRRVAVKFIRLLGAGPLARQRFETEARAIARLEADKNVVAVYRLGECGGVPYLVSQFISGQSLDSLAKPVPWPEVLRIGIGLSCGLASAHKQRVLHRDIKPANIMLAEDGQVKLLDFGLAKLLDLAPKGADSRPDGDSAQPQSEFLAATNPGLATTLDPQGPAADPAPAIGLTTTGNQLGTPLYMSPEAWRGERSTERSDIYSLGAVLYELASGVAPHNCTTFTELRDAVQNEEAPPLGQLMPEIPPRLREIIERCVRREPAQRFGSVAELVAELEAMDRADSGPPIAPPLPSRRRWLMVGGAGLVAASLLLTAGFKLWNRPAEMIMIPGGKFQMGSTAREIESAWEWCNLQDKTGCARELYEREQPIREVAVSTFRLDRTEVTQAAYVAWLNRQPKLHLDDGNWVKVDDVLLIDIYPTFNPSQGIVYDEPRHQYRVLPGYERQPVVQVTWDGAARYCQSLGKRLPTEAEWEYAARGPALRRFPWGDEEPRCDGVLLARGAGQPCAGRLGPQDVGKASQDKTPEGVVDLGGNVSEWVEDQFVARYLPCESACVDPKVSTLPAVVAKAAASVLPIPLRAFRGGNWNAVAAVSRAASRSRWPQNQGIISVGFRCAAGAAK